MEGVFFWTESNTGVRFIVSQSTTVLSCR